MAVCSEKQRTGTGAKMADCDKCNRPAVARLNNDSYLCQEHVEEATVRSLKMGIPILLARRGEAQYLVMPTRGRNARRN